MLEKWIRFICSLVVIMLIWYVRKYWGMQPAICVWLASACGIVASVAGPLAREVHRKISG